MTEITGTAAAAECLGTLESACPFTAGIMGATLTTAVLYYSGYPYYGSYGYSPYDYSGNDYGSNYPYYSTQTVYRDYNASVVARVQERLARAGYYGGRIDGVMGPRTRYAIRAYERRHGLPADGVIDRRLLVTMGIA